MDEFNITCPYCGEVINVLVDGSSGEQDYYEDCSVCCNPILFVMSFNEQNLIELMVKRDDD